MEESPPPPRPPPKDARYTPQTKDGRLSSAPTPTTASKRKRVTDNTLVTSDGEFELRDPDDPTPNKRSRATPFSADASASEDTTPHQPGIRRKRGSRNLSNLNLRHAAEQQHSQRTLSRESKFQEGSLTDKPSTKPPSLYTRNPSGDVEKLMEDYHNGIPTPRGSVDGHGADGRQSKMSGHEMDVDGVKKADAPGFLQFGRQWASTFNPGNFWRKIWSEPKNDAVNQQHIEEEARKAKQKAEVDAKYAEMKEAGQFGLQPVVRQPSHNVYIETPRDSAIEMEGVETHARDTTQAHPMDSESEVPDTTSKPKAFKQRPHFRKPSLTNIKSGLKRVGSDLNLAQTLRRRESSNSLSPVKGEFGSTLHKTESRHDLRKQHRLSKRVSDLEAKLSLARQELNEAFVEASPAPKLTGKFERFTPSATFGKRSKFIPGKLPSLPSERILMAQQAQAESRAATDHAEVKTRKAIDITKLFDGDLDEDMDMNETVRPSVAVKQYPLRASSLFNLDNEDIQKSIERETTPHTDNQITTTHTPWTKVKLQPAQPSNTSTMDPNSITDPSTEATSKPTQEPVHESLDAKLKALDANMKLARRKPKKRKSAATEEDKEFRPGKLSDNDSDGDDTPRKKRKSTNASSPSTKRGSGGQLKASPPKGKKGSIAVAAANGNVVNASPKSKGKKAGTIPVHRDEPEEHEDVVSVDDAPTAIDNPTDEQAGEDDDMDLIDTTLDVVYEEEEEVSTTKIPLNGDPSKPTAKATPARHSTALGLRSRSNSPHKRNGSVHSSTEMHMVTLATEAAKSHPCRQKSSRSVSPTPTKNGDGAVGDEDVVVRAVPGEDGVPNMPNTDGRKHTMNKDPDGFEWPEDVF